MTHDTNEYEKFEEKPICFFKNDKNLVNFDPSTQKTQIFALWLVPFVQIITTFDLKKCREAICFFDTEESCKIWRKTDLWFGKWQKEFVKFSPEHLKVSELVISWDIFSK